jgi:hypothetical protein
MFSFGNMGNKPNKPKEKTDRNADLENILGNYLITQYQLERLEKMLADHIEYSASSSKFMFKHKDRWYNVDMRVEKQLTEEEERKILEEAAEKNAEEQKGFSALESASDQETEPVE